MNVNIGRNNALNCCSTFFLLTMARFNCFITLTAMIISSISLFFLQLVIISLGMCQIMTNDDNTS